uniref:CBM21 domain-containing protein n=2 Tax=Parascaris univalens TaxID=6257 RepID=A0A915AV47_PARUN
PRGLELMKNQQEQHWDDMVFSSTGYVKKLWNSSSSPCIESPDPMKPHSRFDLKLEVGATPQHYAKMIDWSVGPADCSPSSSSSEDEKRVNESTSHDSGFFSDNYSPNHTPLLRTKLERSVTLPSALRAQTPTRSQKSVRFADSMGLDLEQKTFFDENDWCQKPHSFSYPSFSVFNACEGQEHSAPQQPTALTLVPTNFRVRSEAEATHLARTKCVCLRSFSISDVNVNGIIDVLNLAFDKQVCVRYSTNEWMNFADAAAVYMSPYGNDGAVDSFSFSIELPKNLPMGTICHFCIKYTVNGASFWDNNNNSNFLLQYVEKEAETKKAKALRKKRGGRLFGSLRSLDDKFDMDLRPVWPDYCPEIHFPRFKAGGWRHRDESSICSDEPYFY